MPISSRSVASKVIYSEKPLDPMDGCEIALSSHAVYSLSFTDEYHFDRSGNLKQAIYLKTCYLRLGWSEAGLQLALGDRPGHEATAIKHYRRTAYVRFVHRKRECDDERLWNEIGKPTVGTAM
jgi:hypothetical protein